MATPPIRKFRKQDQPWNLKDRIERFRYLVDSLVWTDSICQAYIEDDWVVAKNSSGQRVIPLWPDEGSARATLGEEALGKEFKIRSLVEFEKDFLAHLYDDELIAAFPDIKQEYEVLDREEFTAAIRYAGLVMRGYKGELDPDDEQNLKKLFKSTKKKGGV